MKTDNVKTSYKGVRFVDTTEKNSHSTLARSESNDCVVRALASAWDIAYEESHFFCKQYFHRKNRNGTNGTQMKLGKMILNQYDFFGHSMEMIGERMFDNIDYLKVPKSWRYAKGGKRICAYTIGSWCKKHPVGTYFIIIRGHALTIKNGIVYGNPSDAYHIKSRVMGAFKVEKK